MQVLLVFCCGETKGLEMNDKEGKLLWRRAMPCEVGLAAGKRKERWEGERGEGKGRWR